MIYTGDSTRTVSYEIDQADEKSSQIDESHNEYGKLSHKNSVSQLFRHEYINYKVFLFVHKQSPVIY